MSDEILKMILIENNINYMKNVISSLYAQLPAIEYQFGYNQSINEKIEEIKDHLYKISFLINDIDILITKTKYNVSKNKRGDEK